jgi:hypothetical protein
LIRISSAPNAFFVTENSRSISAFFGDVRLNRDGLAAVAGDLGDDTISAFATRCVVDGHRRAFGGKSLGDGCADAFGRAGNDGDFAVEFLGLYAHGSCFFVC